VNVRAVLALAKSIEHEQNTEGSDYDALYFGLQDVIMMLEDVVAKTTHRSARVRGHADSVYSPRLQKQPRKKQRKLSKWQKFVKANSKKKQFIYQSGAKKGKLNLKKMGVAYRRKNK